jgi:hypothetical protein
MQHTVEDLIRRINVMHDKAVLVHRLRNEFSELSYKEYDKVSCKQLIEDIQALALGIANDKEGEEIISEMEYKMNASSPEEQKILKHLGKVR